MGWVKRTLHPGRCRREAEQAAGDAANAAKSRERQEQAAAKKRQEEAFEKIEAACKERREQIQSWYQVELTRAETDHEKKQTDYLITVEELSRAVAQAKSEIMSGFQEQQARLFENQAEDINRLELCRSGVIRQAGGMDARYAQDGQVLDSLWQQVQNTMLHQQCEDAYFSLKQPINKTQKIKNYSMLAAYFRHLSHQNFLTNADFERCSHFFEALYQSGENLTQDENFYNMDHEIHKLLNRAKSRDWNSAKKAYYSDYDKVKKTQGTSQAFYEALSQKLNAEREAIAAQYDKALQNLIKEIEKKRRVIEENHLKIQSDIESEMRLYEEKYESYLLDLNKDRENYLLELGGSEKQAKEEVTEQYEAQVLAIQEATKKILEEINTGLEKQLKELKRARTSAITNMFTAVAAGVGAYFSGGLLAGLSSNIISMVETSLGATSLGAVSNLVNDKSEMGFKFNVNLGAQGPYQGSDSFRLDGDSHRKKIDDLHINLEGIREKFKDFAHDIEQWQSEAEHNLFYSLNRPVSLPTVDFSESMTVFFNQKSKDVFNIQLGALNQDGLRTVDWGTGRSVMFDRDLRSIFKRAVGVDEPFFNQDWNQSQVFSFNQHAIEAMKNRMAEENRLTFPEEHSRQVVRKKSYLEGVLNYLIPAAEANELSYSTTFRDNARTESNQLVNHFKLVAGLAVGFGQKVANVAMDMLEGGIELLQQSEAIIDEPRLIDAELLERRAAQGEALSFALRHPAQTGRAIFVNYGNEITEGFHMGRLAYEQGRYFESGRAWGGSVAEPAMALVSALQMGKFAVKTATRGVQSGSRVVQGVIRTHEFRSPILFQYDSASLNMGLSLDRMELQYPVRKIINQAQIGDGVPRPSSIPDSMRMRAELAFQEAGILDRNGRLTEFALRDENIKIVKPGKDLHNQKVINELTKGGGNIDDWAKYTTKKCVNLGNGDKKQIHFYRNERTGEVNYSIDFKIKDIVKEYPGISIKNR